MEWCYLRGFCKQALNHCICIRMSSVLEFVLNKHIQVYWFYIRETVLKIQQMLLIQQQNCIFTNIMNVGHEIMRRIIIMQTTLDR